MTGGCKDAAAQPRSVSAGMSGRIAALLLAVSSAAADAELTAEISYDYYDFDQTGEVDLAAALNAATPFSPYFAYTGWTLRWQLHFENGAGAECRIADSAVVLEVTVTLPDAQGSALVESTRHSHFFTQVRRHEQGHVDIARGAADALDVALRRLKVMNSCAALETRANKLGNDLVERARRADARYDEQTEHGRTQGAWLE